MSQTSIWCGLILGVVLFMKSVKSQEENKCTHLGDVVYCIGTRNIIIPTADFSNVRTILLNLCDMSVLTRDHFAAFTEVSRIEIRSSILSFPTNSGLFNKIKDLNYLLIENCEVGEEVMEMFAENESLERLSLPKNRITSISRRLLRNLTSLQELDLSGNGVSHLEDGAFDELKELRVLDLRDNALKGGSAGVVALTPDRCSVCRPEGVSVGCYTTDVYHCVAGRPLDRLWWRSSGLTLRLEGNPVCNESSASGETESSSELYYGDVKCDAEGECYKHEIRKLFFKEACGMRHVNPSNAADEQKYLVEAGIEVIAIYTIGTVIVGFLIGAVSVFFCIMFKQNRTNSVKNIQSEEEDTLLVEIGESSEKKSNSGRISSMHYPRENSEETMPMSTNQSNRNSPNLDNSPLHRFALNGDLENLKMLKNNGVDLTQKNSRGENALWCAAFAGHHKLVQFLIDSVPSEEIRCANHNGDTPLHIAAKEGNETSANILLKNGAKLNDKNKDGSTPLHMAVNTEFTGIIKLLLENTSSINETNNKGETPLLVAVRSGQVEVVKLLLQKRANVSAANCVKLQPLHIAAWNGNGTIVDLLLKNDSPINSPDIHGNTALHSACRKGQINIIQRLLHNGSLVNAVNNRLKTPLYKAIEGDHFETVQLLLDNDADVNIKNADGLTPLEFAGKKESTKCIETLRRHNSFSQHYVKQY